MRHGASVGCTASPASVLFLACLALVACAPLPGTDRISALRQVIQDAELGVAERCSPRELALARAHLEFTQIELDQGDLSRAQEHLAEAELNAEAARKASASGCHSPQLAQRPDRDLSRGDRDADGVPDRVDLCPDEAEDLDEYLDRDGCPDSDNDRDGLLDVNDRCPMDPEDRDGYEDGDGCPELDNDSDGVADSADECPEASGTAAGDVGGCPHRYQGFRVTDNALVLDEVLAFTVGSDLLPDRAVPLLTEVARALRQRPGMRIEVQVHTDSRGDDSENHALSQRQANRVLAFLVDRGIDPARLTAVGYGETRPLESNRTSQGRAVNRRVEFSRLDHTP